jgi:transposase-like zinc-binding protein/putative transposase
VARLAPPYRPRQPTGTLLYGILRENLETFLAHARESYERPLPRYVEQEFRDYLRCGVFAHGFVHCRCDACGHDLLVAFSCKGRGICPSCMGRRMANTGAHLVDRVVPAVPVRQFVLSLPHELRLLAAFKPDVLTALSRIFVEVVFASYRKRAARLGIEGAQPGAITLVQRFGGSLNLHVHFHTCFLDGVFTRDEHGRVRFHALPRPQSGDLEAIVGRVRDRVLAWLRRRGPSSADHEGGSAAEPAALHACAALAVQRGTFAKLADDAPPGETEPGPTSALVAELDGFNLHAGVRIAAGDDLGREKLLRYGARPAFALDRLRRLPDGRIAYRVKYSRGTPRFPLRSDPRAREERRPRGDPRLRRRHQGEDEGTIARGCRTTRSPRGEPPSTPRRGQARGAETLTGRRDGQGRGPWVTGLIRNGFGCEALRPTHRGVAPALRKASLWRPCA